MQEILARLGGSWELSEWALVESAEGAIEIGIIISEGRREDAFVTSRLCTSLRHVRLVPIEKSYKLSIYHVHQHHQACTVYAPDYGCRYGNDPFNSQQSPNYSTPGRIRKPMSDTQRKSPRTVQSSCGLLLGTSLPPSMLGGQGSPSIFSMTLTMPCVLMSTAQFKCETVS